MGWIGTDGERGGGTGQPVKVFQSRIVFGLPAACMEWPSQERHTTMREKIYTLCYDLQKTKSQIKGNIFYSVQRGSALCLEVSLLPLFKKKKNKKLTAVISEILSFTSLLWKEPLLSPLDMAPRAFLEHEVVSASYVSGQPGTNNGIGLDLQSRQLGRLACLLLLSLCRSLVTPSVFRFPSTFSSTHLTHHMLPTLHSCCVIPVSTIFITFVFSSWVN